jgi:hypothetical protein
LEGVNIVQPVLNVSVNDKFGEPEDFTTQVKRVTETRFLTLFCGQRFDGLKWRI